MHVLEVLPPRLYPCLNSQKRAILRTLQISIHPYPSYEARKERGDDRTGLETNEVALQQLYDLISGTVNRGEGNSCLILGPRGSGKTRLVERCLLNIPNKPIILRLSGWTQHSDRLAMREIAHQLNQQTGTTIFVHPDDVPRNIDNDYPDRELNPFLDKSVSSMLVSSASLPLSSHLPTLISALPTLPRPTIVILDGFDLFSLHPRQSLLYCLLDTAQSCHSGAKSRGLAVVGITTRVDTVNLLEKRVKSRFSGRILRTAPPQDLEGWIEVAKATLMPRVLDENQEKSYNEEWKSLWNMAIEKFLSDRSVTKALNETFSITRDIRMLNKIMASLALHLAPTSPFPSVSQIKATVLSQRIRPRSPFLHTLSYPALCLLIASVHVDSTGHSTFTFEMLHECFYDQLRTSLSAPVQVNGGSIGMAFEYLVSVKLFTCIAPSTGVAKEFVKYHSVVAREDVKKAVDKTGQINLRKWFTKAQ
ncbi:origin recognition complex subunit 4 C-terminus-domain-containing protein [Collybia nuda]|uniref:Origin recognition complex subunit 4 C-terminus-domain-containing protein n=1 Tax=Collybia nuda TaxID=64659 RepID=A0A9P6C972_9AGAR|nr:origin recognition complex subunit 4 C-terminus-domain-containing protein [Collybia nuda]